MTTRTSNKKSFLEENINFNFTSKKDMKQFLSLQFIPGFLLVMVGIYLVKDTVSPIKAGLSIMFLYFYSYFVHRFSHGLPDAINLHSVHHTENDLPYGANLLIESITDILFFAAVWGIQIVLNIKIIPSILIFYYGLIYVTVHMINFSLIGNPTHKQHHNADTKKSCNYGPDSVDHIMNTNCDESWEDMGHYIPNIAISYLITDYLRKSLK
tara:strand:- start:32 stop:664 length:633 start_codon:yes stop_codon:yes gene_type:complete